MTQTAQTGFSPEEQFFLQVLRDHVHGRDTAPPPDGLNWDRLARLAHSQQVSGIVYVQCRAWLRDSEAVRTQLHEEFYSAVYYAVSRREDIRALETAFTAADIPFLLVKGAEVQSCYPVPQLRTMGDTDVLIHPRDRARADALLKAQGYTCTVECPAVWSYRRGPVKYEVHDHMIYEPVIGDVDYAAYFERAWEHVRPLADSSRVQLDESCHFLYLITHTAKHLVNKGYGFRPFLDLVFLCRSAGERMDWTWIAQELRALRLERFAQVCAGLCERWFAVRLPMEKAEIRADFFRSATEKMLRDGIFGQENSEENQVAAVTKALRRAALPYPLFAARLTVQRLFPSYRDMREIPWYAFVDGRPWLLPAAWVYRFGYVLRHKSARGRAVLTQPLTEKKQMEQRGRALSEWGL